MIRGTTPTHIFQIPFDTSLIKELKILYAQSDEILLEKRMCDCDIGGDTITVHLTQKETFLFDCKKNRVEIQVRILTTNDEVLSSTIMNVPISKCLDNEVLA